MNLLISRPVLVFKLARDLKGPAGLMQKIVITCSVAFGPALSLYWAVAFKRWRQR